MGTLSSEKIETIKMFIIDRLRPYLIILFGSSVTNKMRPDSDVDVAFLSEEKTGEYEIFMLAQELAGMIGKEVDLVDMNKASSVFKVQILGYGKTIHNSDDYKSSLFKIIALKDYALLNEERRCILDKINERGFAYEQ